MLRNVAIMMLLIAIFANHANSQKTAANQIDIGEKLREELKN